jgi:hypothetical protein
MDNLLSTLITGLIGVASGAILAYFGAVVKFRKDLEAEYDKDLRNRRLEVYKELWKHLKVLARYDRPKPLTPQTLDELSISLREWYFDVGGLYLSEHTRDIYFEIKKMIQGLLESDKYRPDQVLENPDSRLLLDKASLLRARLTHDVGTRKSSPIADS